MDLVFIFLCIIGAIALILFLPVKGAGSFSYAPPSNQIHEADAVLSRRLLKQGTRAYESYYAAHPELKQADDRSRHTPGLLNNHARYYDPASFAAAKANFQVIDFLGDLTHDSDSPVNQNLLKVNPGKVSRMISHWLKTTGAHSVGYTELKEYHLYSHKGRGPQAGKPILNSHNHAIAITVEMDHRMMQSAPEGTSVMESSEQYLRSGVLALKVAAWIRELGYEATAHIDGNYEVVCPVVAVDAGLGTIGRMGLLMTPVLGPRVRISVITTNIPLEYSTPKVDRTTLHFCHHCKKCAHVCPAAAIPHGPRIDKEGTKRWQINSEKCYHLWTVAGTDCGRCISVCPYSHPNNRFHGILRWSIKNNLVFRHLAIKFDDVFYGRKPPVRPMPDWANILDES